MKGTSPRRSGRAAAAGSTAAAKVSAAAGVRDLAGGYSTVAYGRDDCKADKEV